MSTFEGKCHCGEVEWEVALEDDQKNTILCHCNACKTLSGGAYTLNQIVPKSAFKFTKGEDKVKKYTYTGDSGKPVHCYYCSNCTAHAYHHQTALGDDKIVLRTVLLPKGMDFQPAAEVYGKDRFGWEKEVANTFEILPPE